MRALTPRASPFSAPRPKAPATRDRLLTLPCLLLLVLAVYGVCYALKAA